MHAHSCARDLPNQSHPTPNSSRMMMLKHPHASVLQLGARSVSQFSRTQTDNTQWQELFWSAGRVFEPTTNAHAPKISARAPHSCYSLADTSPFRFATERRHQQHTNTTCAPSNHTAAPRAVFGGAPAASECSTSSSLTTAAATTTPSRQSWRVVARAARERQGPSGLHVQGHSPTSPSGWDAMRHALQEAGVS